MPSDASEGCEQPPGAAEAACRQAGEVGVCLGRLSLRARGSSASAGTRMGVSVVSGSQGMWTSLDLPLRFAINLNSKTSRL